MIWGANAPSGGGRVSNRVDMKIILVNAGEFDEIFRKAGIPIRLIANLQTPHIWFPEADCIVVAEAPVQIGRYRGREGYANDITISAVMVAAALWIDSEQILPLIP